MAMQADAVHSLSDVFVSLVVLGGVLLSSGSRQWLRTVENTVALLISAVIMGAGVALFVRAFQERGGVLERIPLAVGITWACVLISLGVARYKIWAGRTCDSPSLVADGLSLDDGHVLLHRGAGSNGRHTGRARIGQRGLRRRCTAGVQDRLRGDGVVDSGLSKSEVFTFETYGYIRSTAVGGRIAAFAAGSAGIFRTACAKGWFRRLRRRGAAGASFLLPCWPWLERPTPRRDCSESSPASGHRVAVRRVASAGLAPGLHCRLPSPFSRLYIEKPGRVRQLEFGFRTVAARGTVDEPDAYLWESRHRAGCMKRWKKRR